ncbi:MAG: serine/threonine-protein phosphatase [Anaerolineae bacterium]|nr:serine/threonine-protein phosphatase [Anaerolineae bacterium]
MEMFKKLFGKKQSSSALVPITEEKESLSIVVGAATDKGLVRDYNQDALFTLSALLSQGQDLQPIGLYIIADGMGGQMNGGEVSSLAMRTVANWILREIYEPFLTQSGATNLRPINEVLTEAIVTANGKVQEKLPKGGTTLTCAFLLGTNAFIAHVGDSRAYLITRNSIRQLTKDHSLVNRLIELGQLTPEEAKTHPQRNVLYRAVGRAGNLEVDTYLQSLPTNSSLLLCCDGLWSMIPEDEILSIVNAESSPQVACRRLIARANDAGGEDNITAVLIQVKG